MKPTGWKVPTTNRRYAQVFLLVCFCLFKQHFRYVTASPEVFNSMLDNQDLSNNALNSKIKLDSINGLESLDTERDKKSSAFFPLRGKKYDQPDDTQMNPWEVSDGYLQDEDKRSHFYPLRGKKVPDDLKRASYFMPMRGRKSEEEAVREDKRMSSFMPMRGKKKVSTLVDAFQHLGPPGTYSKENLYPPSSGSGRHDDKRASVFAAKSKEVASAAKESDSEQTSRQESIDEIRKRLAFFMPMPGVENALPGSGLPNSPDIATSLVEKRKFSFLPMRGRRYQDHNESGYNAPFETENSTGIRSSVPFQKNFLDTIKRRALAFMTTPGRKPFPENDDYREAMKDKRKSNFLPMRGKRSVLDEDLTSEVDNFESYGKRTMSFVPMRGRRWTVDPCDYNEDGSRAIIGQPTDYAASEAQSIYGVQEKKMSSFMPMRGRRKTDNPENPSGLFDMTERLVDTSHARDRRRLNDGDSFYTPFPYFVTSGLGSSFMTRHFNSLQTQSPTNYLRSELIKNRKFDWDSVKRAFHASRGKRGDSREPEFKGQPGIAVHDEDQRQGCRYKRSVFQPRVFSKAHRQYIALKRPMSFFATRGKRMDESAASRF